MAIFSPTQPKTQVHSNTHKRRGQAIRDADPIIHIDWRLLFRRIYIGLRSLLVSFRYILFRKAGYKRPSPISFSWRKLPWLKLGLACMAVYVMTQKNIQFTVNMRAPLAAAGLHSTKATDQLSISQSVMPVSFNKDNSATPRFSDEEVSAYLQRFSRIAQVEMEKFGIPASIKLAQGLLESQAGKLGQGYGDYNHFGAPMQADTYQSAWENWRAHSLWLQQRAPQSLLQKKTYRVWAKALPELGYQGGKNYTRQIIQLIEQYKLDRFDESPM